jgi:hypothetical protein
LINLFRSSLAVCVNYRFFCRADPGARCLTEDLAVDCLFVRKSNDDHRRETRNKLVLAVTIPAYPVLEDVLDYYLCHRTAFCATYFNCPPLLLNEAFHLWNHPQSGRP